MQAAVQAGRPVFVDFTAAYCTVCKVNKAVAINTPEVQERLKAGGVVAFQGDFTRGDPAIFAELQKRGRVGVPLNLIFPPGRPEAPIILEPQLTKAYLLEKLDEALSMRTAAASAFGSS
ncbi:MAG: thioredoxin family protein [Planctomycetes bacterium]|nr:thioredoxin family protein [Planctomycetota bacterium]